MELLRDNSPSNDQDSNKDTTKTREPTHKMIENRYQVIRKIGHGSFSSVYLGYDYRVKRDIAIKKIKYGHLKPKVVQYFENEIEIMKNCDHPNIIQLYDVIRVHHKIYLILEFCHQGDLSMILGKRKHSEDTVKKYMRHIFNGLKYLQGKGIIHRDLKPQNILLDKSGVLKIIDFGFAKYTTNDLSKTMCGSPLYMAPEILYHQGYNEKADLWSLGIIMYQMIEGHTPFQATTLQELISRMKKNTIPWPKQTTRSCQVLLKGLLEKNQKNRIDWYNLERHPWFALPTTPNRIRPEMNFEDIFVMEEEDFHQSINSLDGCASFALTEDETVEYRNDNEGNGRGGEGRGGSDGYGDRGGGNRGCNRDRSEGSSDSSEFVVIEHRSVPQEIVPTNKSGTSQIMSALSYSLSNSYQALRQNINYYANSL